jgi:hypothetical protein
MSLVICEQRTTMIVDGGRQHGENGADLWVAPADLERTTGWALKPEGLCRDEICIPLPSQKRKALERTSADASTRINLTGLWRAMGHPVASDAAGDTWVLGAGAGQRAEALQSLDAPDFSLTDLAGQTHTLSQYRGKKVFLTTWASW